VQVLVVRAAVSLVAEQFEGELKAVVHSAGEVSQLVPLPLLEKMVSGHPDLEMQTSVHGMVIMFAAIHAMHFIVAQSVLVPRPLLCPVTYRFPWASITVFATSAIHPGGWCS